MRWTALYTLAFISLTIGIFAESLFLAGLCTGIGIAGAVILYGGLATRGGRRS